MSLIFRQASMNLNALLVVPYRTFIRTEKMFRIKMKLNIAMNPILIEVPRSMEEQTLNQGMFAEQSSWEGKTQHSL